MFEAYFDESGCDDGSKLLVVGGYLVDSGKVRRLDRKWRAALRPLGLSYFHMVDCAHGNGPYKKLTIDQRIALVTRLIYLIKQHAAMGFMAVVNPKRFQDIPRMPDAYTFALEMVLFAIGAWVL
ncbi:MAG: hypothetical protein WD793_05545 [Steroidobacteraceae bacterium]